MSFLPESYIPLRGHSDRANYFTKKLAERLAESAEEIRWSFGKKPLSVYEIEGHETVLRAIHTTETEYGVICTREAIHKAISLAQNYVLRGTIPIDT